MSMSDLFLRCARQSSRPTMATTLRWGLLAIIGCALTQEPMAIAAPRSLSDIGNREKSDAHIWLRITDRHMMKGSDTPQIWSFR